jgi:hypothetical protein
VGQEGAQGGRYRGRYPRRHGERVAATSADANFNYIPEPAEWDLDPEAAYLHFTSNNTIFGTQFAAEPAMPASPSSATPRRTFSAGGWTSDRYGLIYAGAQKNIGPAGATAVLIRHDFLERTRIDGLATMLDYRTHLDTLFNTPPVFAVYIVEKVLRWLKGQGGLDGIAQYNQRKADTLYGAIDGTDFYEGTARRGLALPDERHLPHRRPRPGAGVHRGGQEGRAARTQGPPLGGRPPRVDLQRLPPGVRRRAGVLHARVRTPAGIAASVGRG